jgi:AcrR family transcriptional regulator
VREAAERVFARTGFQAAKMADIAKAAGVAVGTLYNYFESKEEIFVEIFRERSGNLRAELAPLLRAGTPSQGIAATVRTSFDYLDRHGALFTLFVERGGLAEFDVQRIAGDVCEREYERFLQLLLELVRSAQAEQELRRDVPAEAIAAALSGAMNGTTYAWLKRGRRGRLAAEADPLLTLFFAGARSAS